jgi:hypothetical protein
MGDLRPAGAGEPDVAVVDAVVQIATTLVLVYESYKGTQDSEEQGCFFHGTPPWPWNHRQPAEACSTRVAPPNV